VTSHHLKRGFLWLVTHTVNRVSAPLARSGFGPFALVRHVGRRSGRTYETPLVVARVPGGFVIELTYGPGVDWYRNIAAAGGCVIVYQRSDYHVHRIEPCSTEDGLAAFGFPRSLVLRLLRRHEFRHLQVAESVPAG
jgi:deazaflavin-dependent oxidoreductase (nitroreductase family)